MPREIEDAMKWFRRINLDGIPALLQNKSTAFLSFVCVVAAIDALAGYRYQSARGDRFAQFVREYFPDAYSQHAPKLYLFRCRMLHNFSPAYFSLVHKSPTLHLQLSKIDDTYLSDDSFFSDMRNAAEKYFAEVRSSSQRQTDMLARLNDIQQGGSISVM